MIEPSSWNVLVIDDEPDNSGVVEHVFKFFEIRVRTAGSGPVGLELMREDPPNILLLDIQMPRMSGWEVLRTIRADPALRDTFAIAMTAHAMDGDRERALQAGFDGYLPKPISPISLINDIKDMMRSKQPTAQPIEPPTQPPPRQPAEPPTRQPPKQPTEPSAQQSTQQPTAQSTLARM